MAKVFVTRALPPPGLDMLREKFKVEVNPYDRVLTKDEILLGVNDADAMVKDFNH